MLFSNQNSNKGKFNNFRTKFLYQLIKLRADQEQGTIITVTVVLGLLMLVLGVISISTANGTKNNIISEQGTNQAESITEAGISKSINVFNDGNNEYMLLASFDGTNWTAPTSTDLDLDGDGSYTDNLLAPANACADVDEDGVNEITNDPLEFIEQLVAFNNDNANNTLLDQIEATGIGTGLSAGTYQVESYSYDSGKEEGILQVRGTNSTNTDNQFQYQVTFNVNVNNVTPTTSANGNAAAIMGQDVDTKGMNIYASTAICTEPGIAGNCGNDIDLTATISAYCDDGVLSVDNTLDYSAIQTDSSLLGEYTALETMLGATGAGKYKSPNNKTVTNMIINTTPIPPMPVAPSGTTIVYVNASTGVVTASLSNPSSTIASAASFPLTSEISQASQDWTSILSSVVERFWRTIDAPAYANNGNDGGNTNQASQSDIDTATATMQDYIDEIEDDYLPAIEEYIEQLEDYVDDYPTNVDLQDELDAAEQALVDAQDALETLKGILDLTVLGITKSNLNGQEQDAAKAYSNAEGHKNQAYTALGDAEKIVVGLTTEIKAGNGANSDLVIDVSATPYKNAFVADPTLSGYDAIYIQVSNVTTIDDLKIMINDTALGNINSVARSGEKIDPTRLIIRLYIAENYTSPATGNAAIEVVDGSGNRITADTEANRDKIAALRIIGANANGDPLTDLNGGTPGDLTWDMSGTGCFMGQIHALTTKLILPAGNGCGNAGGSVPLDMNAMMDDLYSTNHSDFSNGSSANTPNVFGAVWAMNLTNNSSTSSGSFFENPSLTQTLAAEFGGANIQITGAGTENTYVHLGNGLTSITRQGIN
jgi:hypothetical protein